MQIKLTAVYFNDKDKNGVPFVSKKPPYKPYSKCSVKAVSANGALGASPLDGNTYIGGFKNSISGEWKVGDVVEVNVVQNGLYWNFETPKAEDLTNSRIDVIEAEIANIKRVLVAKGLIGIPVQVASVLNAPAQQMTPTVTPAQQLLNEFTQPVNQVNIGGTLVDYPDLEEMPF